MAGIERVVTDEAVFAVADNLVKEGKKPTNRAIWDVIGGGSMTTISAALRKWKERQELQSEQPKQRAALPANVSEVLQDAMDTLWQAALDETRIEVEQLTLAANSRVNEAHTERDEALAELQAAAEELELTKNDLTNLNEKIAALTAENEKLAIELKQSQEQSDTAINRANASESARIELKAQVEQLSAMLKSANDELRTERAAAKLAGELAAELKGKLSALEEIKK